MWTLLVFNTDIKCTEGKKYEMLVRHKVYYHKDKQAVQKQEQYLKHSTHLKQDITVWQPKTLIQQ